MTEKEIIKHLLLDIEEILDAPNYIRNESLELYNKLSNSKEYGFPTCNKQLEVYMDEIAELIEKQKLFKIPEQYD